MKLSALLQKQPQWLIIALGILLIALIGGVDYLTGPELILPILFVIVIILLTWFISPGAGILASIVCASIGLLADLTTREYTSPLNPFWNAGTRLGVFLIVTLTLSSLLAAHAKQEEMIYFLVHDLRSPLTNVLTGLRLLMDSDEGNLNEEQKQLVRIGITSGNHLMTLVNSILDLARLESGKMTPVLRTYAIMELFDACIQQTTSLALNKRIHITGRVLEGATSVLADAELTQRILVNLVSNAIKHSPPETVVRLEARPHSRNKIAVSVADKGTGIPPEWLKRIFGRFVQVTPGYAETGSGSGLGLRFCRMAVEAQSGRIWLDSQVGVGTTVTFTLPCAVPEEP